MQKTWPDHESHEHKTMDVDEIDRLSHLVDDILISFLSRLTTKEVVKTSLLSRRWRDLWRWTQILEFDDPVAMNSISKPEALIEGRSRFVEKINNVLEKHLSQTIDEFRITFDLGKSHKSHIDNWVVLALEKKVKKLELDFTPVRLRLIGRGDYTLPLERLVALNSGHNMVHPLRSLILKEVSVSTEAVEWFIRSCPSLVKLSILLSTSLKSIRIPGVSLPLTHLEIIDCWDFECLDICAPRLSTFKYFGDSIQLNIGYPTSLSEVYVWVRPDEPITPAFDCISRSLSRLEYLHLRMSQHDGANSTPVHSPTLLTNLKHLQLDVLARSDDNLLGWTSLIEACPLLEKLTFEFSLYDLPVRSWMDRKESEKPLRCLKTLVLRGILARSIDLEIARYVLHNAPVLQEIIVDFMPRLADPVDYQDAQARFHNKFKKMIPNGVKLTLKHSPKSPPWSYSL